MSGAMVAIVLWRNNYIILCIDEFLKYLVWFAKCIEISCSI